MKPPSPATMVLLFRLALVSILWGLGIFLGMELVRDVLWIRPFYYDDLLQSVGYTDPIYGPVQEVYHEIFFTVFIPIKLFFATLFLAMAYRLTPKK